MPWHDSLSAEIAREFRELEPDLHALAYQHVQQKRDWWAQFTPEERTAYKRESRHRVKARKRADGTWATVLRLRQARRADRRRADPEYHAEEKRKRRLRYLRSKNAISTKGACTK